MPLEQKQRAALRDLADETARGLEEIRASLAEEEPRETSPPRRVRVEPERERPRGERGWTSGLFPAVAIYLLLLAMDLSGSTAFVLAAIVWWLLR